MRSEGRRANQCVAKVGFPLKSKKPESLVFRFSDQASLQVTAKMGTTECSKANVAQSVEHIHGKDEVTSSILVIGSICLTKAAGSLDEFSLLITVQK